LAVDRKWCKLCDWDFRSKICHFEFSGKWKSLKFHTKQTNQHLFLDDKYMDFRLINCLASVKRRFFRSDRDSFIARKLKPLIRPLRFATFSVAPDRPFEETWLVEESFLWV
jgi:hypothetical protein